VNVAARNRNAHAHAVDRANSQQPREFDDLHDPRAL
jgi:hypothetical protein